MIWVAILTILFMIMLVAAFIVGFYTDIKRWRDSKNARISGKDSRQNESERSDSQKNKYDEEMND